MTVKELKAKAKELGLTGYSKLRKAELEELIESELEKQYQATKGEDNQIRCKYCGEVIEVVTKNYIAINDLEDWETECYCEHCGSQQIDGEWTVGDAEVIEEKLKEAIEQVNEIFTYQQVRFKKRTEEGFIVTIANKEWLEDLDNYIRMEDINIRTIAEEYLIAPME